MYVVKWTNPVTRLTRKKVFPSWDAAHAYVEGRERKYGRMDGFVKPKVKRSTREHPNPGL